MRSSLWGDFLGSAWRTGSSQGVQIQALHHTTVSSDETKRQSAKLYPLHLKNHSFGIFIFYSISWFSFSGSLMSICFQISWVWKKMHHSFHNQLIRCGQTIKTSWSESSMGLCLFLWQILLTEWIVGGVQNSFKVLADVTWYKVRQNDDKMRLKSIDN